ncbi:MAG: hypothetical protein QHH75_11910 [Bacillota bacterium]|nr:hypothetical protein [Bacillota bacterium]
MNIGLVDVDGKIPNLALMKISAYHKKRGDRVKFYEPLFDKPDIIYASKIFDFSSDYCYYPPNVPLVKGGTGYDLNKSLPYEVENMCPDYNLYRCNFALGFTTRGCIRSCPFCIVSLKEGKLRIVGDIYDFWTGQKEIVLLDNNLTAAPFEHFERVIRQISENKLAVEFSQGLDIRLLHEDHAKLLKTVRLRKRLLHFAWDLLEYEQDVRRGIQILLKYFHGKQITFYVLIGYNTTEEEDLYRVEVLRGLGVNSFAMPYRRSDPYQQAFSRWVNHKALFESVTWEQYKIIKRLTA